MLSKEGRFTSTATRCAGGSTSLRRKGRYDEPKLRKLRKDWLAYMPVVELLDVDYRSKDVQLLGVRRLGLAVRVEPVTERGMQDYRLDERERPSHHPAAVERLTGGRKRHTIDFSGRAEQPGRKSDPRR